MSGSLRQLGPTEEAPLANRSLAYEEVDGAIAAGASTVADSGPPLLHSSAAASSTGQEVNRADFMNEQNVTTTRTKVTPTIRPHSH